MHESACLRSVHQCYLVYMYVTLRRYLVIRQCVWLSCAYIASTASLTLNNACVNDWRPVCHIAFGFFQCCILWSVGSVQIVYFVNRTYRLPVALWPTDRGSSRTGHTGKHVWLFGSPEPGLSFLCTSSLYSFGTSERMIGRVPFCRVEMAYFYISKEGKSTGLGLSTFNIVLLVLFEISYCPPTKCFTKFTLWKKVSVS